MTDTTDDGQKALQIDAQRLLGRCILRLQQYERLLKAILQMCSVTITADGPSGGLAVQEADVRLKTLGMLVGAFTGDHLFALGEGEMDNVRVKDVPDFSVHLRLGMTAEAFERTKQDLAELVTLRNDLVHHFIEQHDIATVAGCQSALVALHAADERIGAHLVRLQAWATTLMQARQEAARALSSGPVLETLVDSNAATGLASERGPAPRRGTPRRKIKKNTPTPRKH